MSCALENWYSVKCRPPLHRHHILRRGLAQGNKAVRRALDQPAMITFVCAAHNVGRYADTHEARAYLLKRNNVMYRGKTKEIVDTLPWKTQQYDMTWEGLTDE